MQTLRKPELSFANRPLAIWRAIKMGRTPPPVHAMHISSAMPFMNIRRANFDRLDDDSRKDAKQPERASGFPGEETRCSGMPRDFQTPRPPLERADSIESFVNDTGADGLAQFLQDHVEDVADRRAIVAAYGNLAQRKLLRLNRPDLEAAAPTGMTTVEKMREHAMQEYRASLKSEGLLHNFGLFMGAVTKAYDAVPGAKEAYCDEHTFMLQHALIDSGVPKNRLLGIRMVGQDAAGSMVTGHRCLLYAGKGFPDNVGLGGQLYQKLEAEVANGMLILDPWHVQKATAPGTDPTGRNFSAYCQHILTWLEPDAAIANIQLHIDGSDRSSGVIPVGGADASSP